MEIKSLNISELKEAEYNPRVKLTDNDDEFQSLKSSLESFGYVTPIVINSDYTVIGGHQRLNALKELGYDTVDCVVVDLNKDEEKTLNIALNKIDGKWDYGVLSEILSNMEQSSLNLTGFSASQISDIIGSYTPSSGIEPFKSESDESDSQDTSNEIECRVGEFKFTLTSEEYENIIVGIKLELGSQAPVIKNELLRRLLCTK